jgi:DNA polymerase-3 subunit gamma/tau
MAQTAAATEGRNNQQGMRHESRPPYLVLARKYRPKTFDDLIGQEALVTTLRNAFATDRIAQGYMLTGVRGVGKTTTARILSRALNYERDGINRPTFDMSEFGRHCAEIMEGRHPDVIEMDAASNTGVDNIRDLIESARYKPLIARYKVYIVDEVHMLSKGAFNALLKTLEEPPEHVKFIFATTEVRKVPVTVLSRCQRFDLRRVDVPTLVRHFRHIVGKEAARAEEEALVLIARAAGGSVRDGLSLLDQALAMGEGSVTAGAVRAMLGLADSGRVFDLLEHVFRGDVAQMLDAFAGLHRAGAEPSQILSDLAEVLHAATRAKTLGAEAAGEGLSAEERRRAAALGEKLSVALLSRAWQMLIKGLEEVASAPDPAAAAEMVLIRLAYTADLPSPSDIIEALGGDGAVALAGGQTAPSSNAEAPEVVGVPPHAETSVHGGDVPGPPPQQDAAGDLGSFEDVINLAGAHRDAKLKVHLEEHVSLINFDPAGRLEIHLLPAAPEDLANDLRAKLSAWTGRPWSVVVGTAPGERPIGEVRRERAAAELEEVRKHPAVAAVLRRFPEARISVRRLSRLTSGGTATG